MPDAYEVVLDESRLRNPPRTASERVHVQMNLWLWKKPQERPTKNSRSRCSLSQTQVVLTMVSPSSGVHDLHEKVCFGSCFSIHTPPMLGH